ncbi:response regulator transcription factor [Solirubrobacter ginsenosidimutans]|uniref:Response regulator transcription factor n=1 Tax=Solirubrobacter ginsenosidimutans TaxID=490573 RepID=A0A9X3N8S2_9ACTN|nr:response regulator transcription factor [Solirubrobacter ginsenosidimutans]MDA0166928.1 response regulator transcription factor [Solirubrobacter ginsenosidimutans]
MSAPVLKHTTAPVVVAIGADQRAEGHIREALEAAGFAVEILSRGDVVDAVERARRASAQAPVIAVVAVGTSRADLRRVLRAGASGIVIDGQLDEALVPTACAIIAGQLVVPPALVRQLAPRALSFREKQILALVVRGYTNRQIADTLFVAESTVKTHLSSAFHKLETRSRAETAALILDPVDGYGLGVLPIAESETEQAA